MVQTVAALQVDTGAKIGVRHEEGGALTPAARGTTFPNMAFAALVRACGATGLTMRDPALLNEAVAQFPATSGPAVLHAIVDPAELPTMPHIAPTQVARFGIAKVREAWRSLRAEN